MEYNFSEGFNFVSKNKFWHVDDCGIVRIEKEMLFFFSFSGELWCGADSRSVARLGDNPYAWEMELENMRSAGLSRDAAQKILTFGLTAKIKIKEKCYDNSR